MAQTPDDRIADLEERIEMLKVQRDVKKKKRLEQQIPLIALVGYTNVGKSTLFNTLTKSTVLVENKLFATLSQRCRHVISLS